MDLAGKVALVTGSTDGVGRYVAAALGRAGAHVIVHGRDRERGASVLANIRHTGGSAEFHPADFRSLAEVRELAETVARGHDRLDLLVNNAGIGTGPSGEERQITADGFELRFVVNYLSGFLLTRLLLPQLTATRDARIVNVSSLGQHPIDFADVMLARNYSGRRAYCQSKLAQIMFTFDLARDFDPAIVTANCLHPATYMNTTMVAQSGVASMSTVEEGGKAILHLAAAPDVQGMTGGYYDGLRPARAHQSAYDPDIRARLRQLSCELAGLPAEAPSSSQPSNA